MSEAPSSIPRERVAEAISSLWWLPLLRGVLLLFLGCYALFRPGMTIGALAQVIGFFVIANGILAIVAGILGEVPSRLWVICRGVLEIVVGLFVLANPFLMAGITAAFLLYMLAFSAIVGGILEIVAAIKDRKEIEGEGWLILSGALTVLLGLVLLAEPLFFGLMMVRVLGGFGILAGGALIVFAFRLRAVGKQLQE